VCCVFSLQFFNYVLCCMCCVRLSYWIKITYLLAYLHTLSFDFLASNSCHTWRITWPTLPPSLKTLWLFVHELRLITVSIDCHRKCVRGQCACAEWREVWVGGQKRLHFWNARPRFAYSLCNFGGCTTKVIKDICENNARPCVKKRISFCACAKSRDLLEVPYVSYCSRSRRRRFTVLDFKCWAYSRIYDHF